MRHQPQVTHRTDADVTSPRDRRTIWRLSRRMGSHKRPLPLPTLNPPKLPQHPQSHLNRRHPNLILLSQLVVRRQPIIRCQVTRLDPGAELIHDPSIIGLVGHGDVSLLGSGEMQAHHLTRLGD